MNKVKSNVRGSGRGKAEKQHKGKLKGKSSSGHKGISVVIHVVMTIIINMNIFSR